MIEITKKSNCSGCYACVNICPQSCIQMIYDEEGFWYPKVDKDKCIDCGLCEKKCPIINKCHPDEKRTTLLMAAINNDEEIRLNSSSGGIFTLLAKVIIEQGGIVFGAAFADDFKSVNHICVESIDDLDKLRGSKYVQSKIGDTYKQVKKYLDSNRKVLFTGTPCQIGGLYSFIKRDYDNLYTQDLICHGVPSPLVWRSYVEEREKNALSVTRQVFFRNKRYGWKKYAVLFEFLNKTTYIKSLQEDSFMKAFLSNICLRPSCYECSFKGVKRQADISLADFWGIQNELPEMDDDKGTSLVLIHSSKGKELFDSISNNLRYENVEDEVIRKYNSSCVVSCKRNPKRELFLKDIQNGDFEYVVDKYTKISFFKRVRMNAGKVIRSFIR